MNIKFASGIAVLFTVWVACVNGNSDTRHLSQHMNTTSMNTKSTDTVYFGAGCFWCVEAVFQRLKGVESVSSGYTGGHIKNPTYKEVCSGLTGHAEVCRVVYHPDQIDFATLLKAFFTCHDPTTLNRQGNDIGSQYRSAIYFTSAAQQETSLKAIDELNKSAAFANPIVTEVTPFTEFYVAEDYHQNYYNDNGEQPYCRFVIQPKIEKFEKVFKDLLKK